MTARLATPEGTARYAARFRDRASDGHFRVIPGDLVVSSIGLGTYLGEADDAADHAYETAIAAALQGACNVVDTAINYRCQHSERDVGNAVRRLLATGRLDRDEVVVCTKGGYVPFDGEEPEDPVEYLRSTFVVTGIAPANRVVQWNCIHHRYIADQVERSLKNLRIGGIDVYFLHNPEVQLQQLSRVEFLGMLADTFAVLEEACARGELGCYGLATWNGFRVPPSLRGHLPLQAILEVAERVGGAGHHLRAVQMPLNLEMPEALTLRTQVVDGEPLPALEAAKRFGLATFASASLLQGDLAHHLPAGARAALPGLATDAQRALQWSRSVPGVDVSLVGMKDVRHVEENLHLAHVPPADPAAVRDLAAPRG
ncbi:aldo/keto reductase [Myxococcota bacterium]|nr:aldo/keto reductase [Myxococcota bacterium]